MSHSSDGSLPVAHQFEDAEQQLDSYTIGMWIFLVTEVLFFGGLFTSFLVYQNKFHDAFKAAHLELDWRMGALNTAILITSSLTMALGVRQAMLNKLKGTINFLIATIALAMGFMVVKYFEYSSKFEHHLVPGPNFEFHTAGVDAGGAQIFFGLYFGMTGLHGFHVLVGILIMVGLIVRQLRLSKLKETRNNPIDYIPVELTGLYWHFVDLVWIFLFPMLYLIG
jgi:cytochrome c oxidase subunit 3